MIEFRSDFTVELVDYMGSDNHIANVARVSTGTTEPDIEKNKGLLNMLMRDRHGTPWESAILQFYIETPLFVNREFFRHRIASYNETSARYREVEPIFYVPSSERPAIQKGKPGAYVFTNERTDEQELTINAEHVRQAKYAWAGYQAMLSTGVAREVARNVLPVSLYSPFYVTMNLRSLFNFLSLRRVTENTTTPTMPLYEIDQVAGQMEELAAEKFPVALSVFNQHGRVCP
jgi:thymidylate synthase (FAD)